MSSSSGQPLLDGFVSRLLGARLAGAAIEDVPRCGRVSGVVLFVDIVDSTSMTDRLAASGPDGAERLGGLLNDYFREVIDIVTAHGGDVIRINGDAVIALWRDDGPSAAAHLQAAHAAIALRDIRHVWPVDPPQPLRHRLTSVAGTFNAVILSASGKRSFLVFAGERLRTIEAISHSGQPGEIVLDGTMARLLAPCAVLRPIVEPGAAAHGATRLDRLEEGRALPPVLSPPKAVTPTPPAADAFVPRIVIERGNSGLSGWLAEFRVLTMVYARLGGSDVPDAAAAERLQTIFEVVANAVDAMGVELFELIANENGIIAQIACGLPSFGVESNATRAVEIARRICEEVAAVGVPCPVGVSTGRAFCGDVGTTIRREYVLTGPVMNYGARLMQAAGSNVICDAETVRETNTRFTFSAGEEIFVRGRRQPLTVHRLIEARASPTLRVRYATGLHGRDSELTQLAARLELLCGGVGGLVTVEGEPGAGKSRLLAEFGEAARRRGCAIIETSTHAIE
jgi:class 3 adenylate cyclase